MTTLGTLVTPAGRANGKTSARPLDALDLSALVASLAATPTLGPPSRVASAVQAWINQDDDAHEPCSLTACRHPLHPGPCKGWKGTLHAVAPGTYKQIEEERVRKANERRIKRIADLKAQNKPIPRKLLEEIKPKPAPTHHAQPVPLGQVNQKADLAGGQAHHAGQAVSKAAGVVPSTPPPLGPKQKKPTVAGRGPAFVITQPKVTDQYKLDKAAKITPQEWDSLSAADKTAIRSELTAIKARGFGPQQTKADALLAKLPAPTTVKSLNTPGNANKIGNLTPGTPGTVTTPSGKTYQKVGAQPSAPGKVTLGKAAKAAPSPASGKHDPVAQVKAAQDPAAKLTPAARLFIYRRLDKKQFDSLDDAAKKQTIADLDDQIANGSPAQQQAARTLKRDLAPAAPGGDSSPAPTAPKALPAHVQGARAVAARTFGAPPTAKKHLTAYGQLSKDDFDSLDATTQRIIRDDLANAKSKFLDPKKQQQAQDLLDRFGSKHPTPAAPTSGGVKGYSDPMNQAVKAAHGSDTDEMLKRVGALSRTQIGNLDDADRKTIAARLDFVASHPKATKSQEDRATAYKRIIEHGSPVQGAKRDHEPSLGELHADEQKAVGAAHPKAAAALKAADDTQLPRADRLDALSGMDKAQFDSLTSDEQRKITDALHELHTDTKINGSTKRDQAAEDALTKYTGVHPGIHRLRRAEADFRAGRIDADKLWANFLRARVQAPGSRRTPGSPGDALEKEAERVAEDNPKLPFWLRATMIENPYGGPQYGAIAKASNKYNFEDAPRLSATDITQIFQPTAADLAKSHPIHAEAVRALRAHIIETGLAPNSPWTDATRNHVVDNLLHISYGNPEIPADRLAEFNALPPNQRNLIRRVVQKKLDGQTDNHAKSATWLALRELEARAPLSPEQRAAVLAATDSFPRAGSDDVFRRLDPAEFDDLPVYTRAAIVSNLGKFQTTAERGGPVRTWTAQDNALKVFPDALAAHLEGNRTTYATRSLRNASDIANYGTKIINPHDRIRAYSDIPFSRVVDLAASDQRKIEIDLSAIEANSAHPLAIRWAALTTRDMLIPPAVALNHNQMDAIDRTDPRPTMGYLDGDVMSALNRLDKADYDSLDKTYREAIDERIKTLPAAQQQAMAAKYHPVAAAAPAATPSGFTPTAVQPNVPTHVQAALDTIYGVHPKSHTMAHQLSTYGTLRGSDFAALNGQEQSQLLGDLSFIATTAKGPSADKAKKLIDRFTPAGTPSGQVPTPPMVPPANAVPGQQRFATPLKGLAIAKDGGKSGDEWIYPPGHSKVWGKYGASGLLIKNRDPQTGEERYLMVQRGPAISDPGKWTFPGGASESKETPHEGATRETIEELGLSNDQFKDALVHGDFTYSIPNHPWKYTTVAVEVPQQFKPNLSTAHARAETSDAKWMTLAEIQALDKQGKLHGPIANGALEKNVMSLYPSGTTLGQLVRRPGPVTKRQGRLSMPSGGRQAPAAFNAWTKPHKQSKGKDLIPDKATFDAMRQALKQDRKPYDAKTADGRLAAIGAKQGFDDTPTVVDKKEIDRLLATGDYIEAWRGVSGAGGGWSARSRGGSGGKTAADINEEMRSGPAYYGKGIFGNGYYLATQRRVAEQYSDHTRGSVVRILIPKSAVTQKYDKVSKESFASSSRSSKAKGAGYGETSTFWDPGRYAAAKGLDGIEIESHHMSPQGGASHVAARGKPAFNWLNRSVLIVQKEPG